MQDRIIEGYLKDFTKTEELDHLKESDAFEYFINYCVVSRDHPDPFELEDTCVGGSGDLGIDGIAVLVNDHVVSSKEDVDFFKKQLRRLDVRFIFIQSKTSAAFDAGEIGNFLFGVRTFFMSKTLDNSQLKRARELKEYVYDSSIDMDKAPVCDLYYATLGKWTSDKHLKSRVDSDTKLLRDTDLFSDVTFTPLDADAIKALYRELKRKVVKEIAFEKHTILPRIDGVQEAYIGVLPAKEYLKLICDENGRLQRSLFYDNVRDFQGNNPVNQEIRETLQDATQRDKFTVLNNGITVVAQSLTKIGFSFKLIDFQVVNGCQTSHVLYSVRAAAESVQIPIKLIVTTDQEVTNAIIKGTNRQTEVKIEAFESLNPFQKDLEEFYSIVGEGKAIRLYYERRSRQYDHLPINPHHIISLTAQVKSFVGMFLAEPHSTHRYYGELLNANRNRIFLSDHSPFPYYIAGYALYSLEQLFHIGALPRRFKKFKFQLLMFFRLLSETSELPYLNNKKAMEKYCSGLLETLLSSAETSKVFKKSVEMLEDGLKKKAGTIDAVRLRSFTNELIEAARPGAPKDSVPIQRELGVVKWFSDIKGYGFIQSESRDADLFVHFRSIRGTGYRSLTIGDRVEYSPVEAPGGPKAEDVVRLPQS